MFPATSASFFFELHRLICASLRRASEKKTNAFHCKPDGVQDRAWSYGRLAQLGDHATVSPDW
jgi:hypothetical protein